jgi:hypothetical protein
VLIGRANQLVGRGHQPCRGPVAIGHASWNLIDRGVVDGGSPVRIGKLSNESRSCNRSLSDRIKLGIEWAIGIAENIRCVPVVRFGLGVGDDCIFAGGKIAPSARRGWQVELEAHVRGGPAWSSSQQASQRSCRQGQGSGQPLRPTRPATRMP